MAKEQFTTRETTCFESVFKDSDTALIAVRPGMKGSDALQTASDFLDAAIGTLRTATVDIDGSEGVHPNEVNALFATQYLIELAKACVDATRQSARTAEMVS